MSATELYMRWHLVLAVALSACSSTAGGQPPIDAGADAGPDAGPDADAGDASIPDDPTLPPDPAKVAPPLDRSVATSVFAASSFLYTGDHPIQTGVAPATIDGQRVAVLRGRVTGRDGTAVRGGTVTVLGHPEFGQTRTRNDGAYDLVTNGGGALVVEIRKDGFLTAQRTIDVPWQDYVPVPAIVMLQPDPAATPIDLAAAGMQVARGSTVTDASGTRRATLLFAPGTQATTTDGAATTTLSTLTVHLTEFTNGPTGPAAMPGSLPPTSAYTYAVEITVDEAAGHPVQLNQPAFLYVENFLGFAPGTGMPVGAYDPDRGQWSGLPNGIILKLIGITSGLADLDSDGDGAADSAATLAALGVTDQERQTLAGLYTAGTVLWRSPIPHFSSFDCNRPFRLPGDARRPRLRDPNNPGGDDVDDDCDAGGSIIQCHNQSLGEDVPVNGTRYFLHYQSDRQAGRRADYSVDIALSDNDIPPSATAIALDVEIAGQSFHQSFPPTPNQHTVFTWDGKDGYGRMVQGRAIATIQVGYVYQASYADPSPAGDQFAQFAGALIDREASPIPTREQVTISQQWKTQLGPFDALPLGLGGFTLSVQHTYDAVGQILYLGNGDTRRAITLGKTVLHQVFFSGTASSGLSDEYPARLRADGKYYTLDANSRVVQDELSRVVAGVRGANPCPAIGDGGPATKATLCNPRSLATGPDGSFYVTSSGGIRRVTPDGIIRTIAGGQTQPIPLFQCAPTGVGGPAVDAHLCDPREMTAARDGALYFRDKIHDATAQIFKIGVDGYLSLVAGNGTVGFSGDGGLASQAELSADLGLALDPDGSLVVADRKNNRVRRISTDGLITTIAGTGATGDSGDGGPASSATFTHLAGVAVAADGSIVLADSGTDRVRVVSAQGVITALAGDGQTPASVGGPGRDPSEGLPPTDASLFAVNYVAIGPDGAVYLGNGLAVISLFSIAPALPKFSPFEHLIPSTDGDELYVFDNAGRHARTLDGSTGAVRISLAYDTAGHVISITDIDGKVTQIERNVAGDATAIVAPFHQRTSLALDQDKRLTTLTDPASGTHLFTYGDGGLLATYTDARAGQHVFSYDSLGRLTSDKDPGQGMQTLVHTGDVTDSTVVDTTTLGRSTTYRIQRLPSGDQVWSNTLADGAAVRVQVAPDGSTTSTAPDGTVVIQKLAPDPRFGMAAPVTASLSVQTPNGLVQTQTISRTANLSNPDDPTSVRTATETFTLNGKSFTRTYDAASKTVTVRTPLGRQAVATLDSKARIVNVTGLSATALEVVYDGLGRPTSIIHGPRVRTLTFGDDGRVETSADAVGHTVRYERDAFGRVMRTHQPDGGTAAFTFNANSDLTSVTPSGETSHSFQRDVLGLVQAYVAPDAGPNTRQTSYDYNADHQVTAITAPDGAAIGITYDPAGRPSHVSLAEGTIDATYDVSGRMAAITAPGSVGLTFGYDGALVTQVAWTGPVHGTIHAAFDNDFRIASESVDGEPAVAVTYDDDGLAIGLGALTLVRDGPTGRLTQATVGSVVETYTSNEFGELANTAATCNGTAIHAMSLTRDAAGTITATNETVLGQTTAASYTYDAMGQLTMVQAGTRTATYAYDGSGNRISAGRPDAVTDAYDGQHRLIQHGATTYAYAANGHLRSKMDGAATTTYGYDLLGNLRSVQLPDGRAISYVVDGLNRRIGKSVGSVLQQGWLYDSATNIVAEIDASGAVVSRFVYGTRPNAPDYLIRGGSTYRILSDHDGSPRLVVDVATCQVVQQIDYDEFGRIIADTNPGFQPFGFAGGLADRDTGLVRFGARDYDPEVGRWTAKDPVGFAGGDSNLYAYAGNNPVNFIDPSGLGVLRGLSNFTAAFGDKLSFGFTKWVRKKWGINGGVDPCSLLYTLGGGAAELVVAVATDGLGAQTEEAGAGLRLYHGTDISSARNLLRGADLEAEIAVATKIDGEAGFFLATDADSAAYFAGRRAPGGVLQYDISAEGVAALTEQGAVLRDIPAGGMRGGFPGQEFFVPTGAFGLFNALRAAGHVIVGVP